jgi:N-acetylglucosaminyldiphosphoundecaprenol N-acetyl-beta-D-mannosaminyltransferase
MKVNILGVLIDSVTFPEATTRVKELLLNGDRATIFTPNPEFIIYAQKDKKFRDILNQADLAIPDGVGLVWASRILGQSLQERVAGADLAEKAVELASELGKSVFFLGGRGDTSVIAARGMQLRYPGLRVAGTWSGEAREVGDKENLDKIGQEKIGLLLVAYGHPKQEYWLERNLSKLNVNLAMGVGGTFDFWSGKVRRAPGWLRAWGLEWLYRLITQPWRIRRQLTLLKFIWLVFEAKFSKSPRSNP